jgi:hypothetical protein
MACVIQVTYLLQVMLVKYLGHGGLRCLRDNIQNSYSLFNRTWMSKQVPIQIVILHDVLAADLNFQGLRAFRTVFTLLVWGGAI